MTNERKVTANQQNALNSTGPSSAEGKAITRMNALSHGLRSAVPVIPGEDLGEWEEFRNSYIADLYPSGLVELELASRAAALSWRLRRVERFETNSITAASDDVARLARGELTLDELKNHFLAGNREAPPSVSAVEYEIKNKQNRASEISEILEAIPRLSKVKGVVAWSGAEAVALLREILSQNEDKLGSNGPQDNEEFFLSVGVPVEDAADPDAWDGWTSAAVNRGVRAVARTLGVSAGLLLERTARRLSEEQDGIGPSLDHLSFRLELVRANLREAEAAARRATLMPPAHTVEPIIRYEAHLQRQLFQVLRHLAMLQTARSGGIMSTKVGVFLEASPTAPSPGG